MTKRKLLLISLPLLLLVVGAATLWLWPTPVRTVEIVVSGPTGSRVVGTYQTDGASHAIDAPLPARVQMTGREVSFVVQTADSSGDLQVALHVGAKQTPSARVVAPGVRGQYRGGKWLVQPERFGMNSFAAAR